MTLLDGWLVQTVDDSMTYDPGERCERSMDRNPCLLVGAKACVVVEVDPRKVTCMEEDDLALLEK